MSRRAVVGVRALKTRLGGYLQQVRLGRTLVVTDRGEPVAEIRPLPAAATEAAKLDRLEALGLVTRAERRPLPPFVPVPLTGPTLADAVAEDRDERG
jgi:prevent-host-death family protein